jgi:hypothetical protein
MAAISIVVAYQRLDASVILTRFSYFFISQLHVFEGQFIVAIQRRVATLAATTDAVASAMVAAAGALYEKQ